MGFTFKMLMQILKFFGADVHELSWFWIIAPYGTIVQPIIGHYSDKRGEIRKKKTFL
jgi:maltose/moltooligosaccharide transporter